MNGSSQVAKLLKVSLKEAIFFCDEVRALSGLGNSLPYKMIAKYLAQNISRAHSAQKIADIISERKAEIYQENTSVFLGKGIFKRSKHKVKPQQSDFLASVRNHRRSGGALPPRRSSLDEENHQPKMFETAKWGYCLHGVPHGRICAICEPKKFHEMTGID